MEPITDAEVCDGVHSVAIARDIFFFQIPCLSEGFGLDPGMTLRQATRHCKDSKKRRENNR